MSKGIRSFFSIEPPPTVKLALGDALTHWDTRVLDSIRLVSSENLHMTVKFLGYIHPGPNILGGIGMGGSGRGNMDLV